MKTFFWEVSNNFHVESFVIGVLLAYFIMLILHELDLDMARARALRGKVP